MSIFVSALVGERMEESAGNRRTGQRRGSPRFKSFGSSGDYPVTQDSSLKKKNTIRFGTLESLNLPGV